MLVTLTDGRQKLFSHPVTIQAAIAAIDQGLANKMVAASLNGCVKDTSTSIQEDVLLEVITAEDPAGLSIVRHSAAHLLAQAVKKLFPEAKMAIGPVIEDGFYYDFSFHRAFTPDDLKIIEKTMQELVKADLAVARQVYTRDDALHLFERLNETYKVEMIRGIPDSESLTVYQQGDFLDLCRGPHVPRTGFLKAVRLTKVAGAYWRGDSRNEMLQRIYGTAWADQHALSLYLKRLEEAEKRDHRVIGKKMSLFHFQQEAPGNVFWHPNGWTMVRLIRQYIRHFVESVGYQEVHTPQLVELSLWEKSGHLAKFDQDMFICHSENHHFAIKPMSCPCHVQIFKQGLKSYRDLPVRYAEFGSCHRNEPSGTLHGLMRLRAFTQDDGHIFCMEDQIEAEVLAFIGQLQKAYAYFGFKDILYILSTRPEKRVGEETKWDQAEQALAKALDAAGVPWKTAPGEGAFYGPKIEFSLQDCLGRVWQCGTVQVDFSTAQRLEAYYIDREGTKAYPVMLHRAILGSVERFLGILLEHYIELPLWLAPVQVVLMNITDQQASYVSSLTAQLQKGGFRAKADLRNEKIGYKIREHTITRVPYQVIIGDREMSDRTLSVRRLSGDQGVSGDRAGSVTVEEFLAHLHKQVELYQADEVTEH